MLKSTALARFKLYSGLTLKCAEIGNKTYRQTVSGQAKKKTMNKQTIIINGNKFTDVESFYDEIDRVLTKNLDWKTGHNLNAFNDLLWGGFGVYEYEEQVKITWTKFTESKKVLGNELSDILIEIIKDHEHIEFEIVD